MNENQNIKPKKEKVEDLRKKHPYEGIVEKVSFGGKGIVRLRERRVEMSNVIEGQKVKFQVYKFKKGKSEGGLIEILEKSPIEDVEDICKHNTKCGGCLYQTVGYSHQIQMKEKQVIELFEKNHIEGYEYKGIKQSPQVYGYRNRMDFTFGDEYKGGPLECGLHKMFHFNDVVTVEECKLVENDFTKLLLTTRDYFREKGIKHFHKMNHEGFLRYLLIRKGKKTGEIMYCIITTSKLLFDFTELKEMLLKMELDGKLVSILHGIYDNPSDVVTAEKMEILYGQDYITEELLGLKFKITPFSFFQTNSLGAEVLYQTVRDYISEMKCETVFDLYSGTGTITQLIAPICKKIIGVELNEEAVKAARINAELNKLTNCEFRANDVGKELDYMIDNKPELIILDPPRTGLLPQALNKIVNFGAEKIVYVSCMPKTLVRDLQIMNEKGYKLTKVTLVDMFPHTAHIETVCLLEKKN